MAGRQRLVGMLQLVNMPDEHTVCIPMIARRRRSKSELTIPERASAAAASLQGRLRANHRRGGGGGKARNTRRRRGTSAYHNKKPEQSCYWL
jgi:hypothetical protein